MTQEASSANPNAEPPYILALDVGTSSTRALLFDATGNTLMNVLDVRPEQFPPLGDLHESVQGLTPKYASA